MTTKVSISEAAWRSGLGGCEVSFVKVALEQGLSIEVSTANLARLAGETVEAPEAVAILENGVL